MRTLVALNGSPVRGGSVDRMLQALLAGAEAAGGRTVHLRCDELDVRPCVACGPEPADGYCVFHDGMDAVYAALEAAHAVAVGSPVWFDGVSSQLKLVIDRCNCVTPLVRLPHGGEACVPRWQRTRRGVFVTACSADHRHDFAERMVRGWMKWTGAKWEETLAWVHADNAVGSVTPDLLDRARAIGARLIESPPLES